MQTIHRVVTNTLLASLVLLFATSCDELTGKKGKYEAFAKECQKAVYEDHFSSDFGTIDADSVVEAGKRVEDNGEYLSLSWRLIEEANPSSTNCRMKNNTIYSNTPGFTGWDVLDGNGRGKVYDNWNAVP